MLKHLNWCALAIGIGVVAASPASAQTAPTRPSFEVTSVRPAAPDASPLMKGLSRENFFQTVLPIGAINPELNQA